MDMNYLSISSSANKRGWHSSQKQTHEIKEITFDDVIDAVNPLNHLPFISEFTNEPISPVARMIGGAALGGPLGFAISAINAVFEEASGDGLIGTAMQAEFSSQNNPYEQARAITNAHKRHLHTWRA